MTSLFNQNIIGYDQFVADYQAITKYQIPDLAGRLESCVIRSIREAGGPEKAAQAEIPDVSLRFGGRIKRDYLFRFRWNEGAERFDAMYTGCREVVEDKLDFYDIEWLSWPQFEDDYRAVMGEKGGGVGDLQYELYTRFSRSACVDGQEERIWVSDSDGNRHYFNFIFNEPDGKPMITYALSGKLEMKAYKLSEVHFERWGEFEEICETLLRPTGWPDFVAVKEAFAGDCVATPGESVNSSVYVERRHSFSGKAYKFWFTLSNDMGQPIVTYRNYRVV